LAKRLGDLNYYWMEEPMDEHSMSSYIWLCQQTSPPICGPETCEGKMHVRAEWIKHNACDISRAGVGDVGSLTPLMKTIHLCESFGVRCEIHGGGFGNLAALCAMRNGEFYERGLASFHRLRRACSLVKPTGRSNGRSGVCSYLTATWIRNGYQLGLY